MRKRNYIALSYVAVTIAAVGLYCASDLSPNALLAYAHGVHEAVEAHYAVTMVIFAAAYLVVVCCSLPLTVPLNCMAGFLFGAFAGAGFASLLVTIGATGVYFVARSVSDGLRVNHRDILPIHPFLWLVLMRLSPMFPAPLINLATGLMRLPVPIFIAATWAGSFPLILFYAWFGQTLESVPSWDDLAHSSLWLPLVLLTLLSIMVAVIPAQKLSANFMRWVQTQSVCHRFVSGS